MSKSLSKTQKKTDDNIRQALNEACNQLLDEYLGFSWLTHQVDYTNFPASLIVTCIFESRAQQEHIIKSQQEQGIWKIIQGKLIKVGIKVPRPAFQIRWDNEEDCVNIHDGNWKNRLNERIGLAVPKNRPH